MISSCERLLAKEKEKSERLERELMLFRQALDGALDAIAIQNELGQRIYFNPAFSEMFEWPLAEMKKKKKVSEIFLEKEDEMFSAIREGGSWAGEMLMQSLKSLQKIPTYTRASAIYDEDGNMIGTFGAHTDIRQQKEGEKKLRKAHKALQEMNQNLESLVAERTRELQVIICKLEREMEERKRLSQENDYLHQEIRREHDFGFIIGGSPKLEKILQQVQLVAQTNTNVLIYGESGTGKELIARAIHEKSNRHDRPLVKVNCASIPGDLFESEFFGHVKGAFTGALKDRTGRFQLANHGTIFLDEVGEIPLDLQSKLLRVLQEGEFEKLGDDKTQKIDVRIIAATNRNLPEEIKKGTFREDLYYRLSVFPIEVPPLRERIEDIAPLAHHFLKKFTKQLHQEPPQLTSENIYTLQSYSWPGNIRELQNVIERAAILAHDGVLRFFLPTKKTENNPSEAFSLDFLQKLHLKDLKRLEKELLIYHLECSNWKIYGDGGAAEKLGIPPTTLTTKMRSHNIKNKKKSRTKKAKTPSPNKQLP